MIGTKVSDRYEVRAELGRGGMGVVYRARDPVLNRDVAIKLVPPTLLSPEGEQRFQREAQLVAQMDHPAIVPIYDFGRHEGSLFFLMPVVEGMNLRGFLREGAVLGDVLDVGIQVGEALEYSHARGVVHRDIKPDNIMVARDEGGGVRVRVMDFGLARAATENRLTRSGAVVGTLSYISPEQVTAQEVDARSDVYSLGSVLYECVVGSPPFSGDVKAMLYRIVHELPQAPRSLGAHVDQALETLILACLAKEPGRRPQRAGEVVEALRRYRAGLRESEKGRSVAELTRTVQVARPALPPFVGRAREFTELQERLNAAVGGECQFVVLSGEPGIGKTRLLDELETLARARRIRVLHGRFVEQDGSFPYQGFCEVVQEHCRFKEDAGSAPPDLSDLAGDLVALFPILAEITEIRSAVRIDSGPTPPAGGRGPEDRTRIFDLLARALTRIGAGRPLVLILEDLHGAEASLEALQYVVRRLGPTPTLILGSYRSTEVDARHPLIRMLDSFRGDRRFLPLTLGPFSPSEHRLLLESLVGGSTLAERLVDELYDGTKGNPFFAKELVRSLLESGGIARDDSGTWRLSGETTLATDALPATIQQAVQKRIARLPEAQREVVAIASVIGRSFDARDVEVLAEGKWDLEDALDRLVEEGLLEEERASHSDLLTFPSGVIRDVLYAGLSRRRRRSLHRRYAELLETRHRGRPERVLPLLVHHFSQGDVPEKTVEYGLRLARASVEAFSGEEAARAVRTALEFLDQEWAGERSVEGEARLLLAQALGVAGDVEGALREAGAAAAIFEQEKEATRGLDALLLAAETAWQARRIEDTSRWVGRGLSAARGAAATDSLRRLLSLAATHANLQGDYEKANEYLEEAARLDAGPGEAVEIAAGGTLVVGLANPVPARVPEAIQTLEEQEVLANVFETLFATDTEGRLVPALCERWEVGEDGTSFQLTLRGDVCFQDGQPLLAEHVKASFERAIASGSGTLPAAFIVIRGAAELAGGQAREASGIRVLSERKLQVQLLEPLPLYPALLSHQRTAISRAAPAGAKEATHLGTGPFRIASHDSERVVLERNAAYWKGTPPRLDRIEFRAGLRAVAIASGLRSGELDLGGDLLPQDLEELLRDTRFRGGLYEALRKNTYFVLFNARSGPAAREEHLRRALAGVVRTRDIVWRTLGRFAEPAAGLIPPGMLGHDPGRRRVTLDRDQAEEELRLAGFSLPLRLTAAAHPLLLDRYGQLTRALTETWSELGVRVEFVTASMESYLEAWANGDGIDLVVGRWTADYEDSDNFTHTLFHSRTGYLRSYFGSAAADAILEEARTEPRPQARETLYRRFESLLQEASVLVPLFHDVDYRVASPRVRGLSLRGTVPSVNYGQLGRAETAESAAESARAPRGVIHVPIAGVVNSLDPTLSWTVEQSEVIPTVFETLTRQAEGAHVVPWLAAELRVEEGGRRFAFRLREDVRFHDGRRLTPRDVRYSWERLLRNRLSPMREFFSVMKGARALIDGEREELEGFRIVSATEFGIELEEPLSFFPALVAYEPASILPEGSDPTQGPEGFAGTGPFRVVRFDPGRRLELERNKAYWRRGHPRSEALVFDFGVTPDQILAGFRGGRFSLASDLFPKDVEGLRREPEFASGYRETPRLATYYVALNRHRGSLADRRQRHRLARGLDVPLLVRQSLGRLAFPAQGFIPPGLLGHEPAPARTVPDPPPEEPGAPIELTASLNPVFYGGYSALAEDLMRSLHERGFAVRPITRTMAEFLEATAAGSVDIVIGRWVGDYPDTDTFVQQLHSQRGVLGKVVGTPEIDRLVEKGRVESATTVRHSLYRQIEEILAEEALLIPLFHEQVYRFARPEIEGLSVSFWGQTVPYESLYFRT